MMADVLDPSVSRKPVGVDVERRHEDGDLDRLPFDIFRFIDLLDDNHLAVDRTDDHVTDRSFVMPFGTAEEIEDKGIDQYPESREARGENYWRQKEPHRYVQQ